MNQDEKQNNNSASEQDQSLKIQSLRDMINNAEKTIQGAKAMLLQLEGKKKTGRKRKVDSEEGTVIQGTFDGQIMIGTDGKQYPVPANYASKSKLVEGDMLKLTITPDGSFIYKQIGPVERKNAIGIVSQDESGNFYVISEGKPYKVLLASITYFKAAPGDEATIVTSREIDSSWCSLETILNKAKDVPAKIKVADKIKKSVVDNQIEEIKKDFNSDDEEDFQEPDSNDNENSTTNNTAIVDEWLADVAEIAKEIEKEKKEKENNL